MSGFDEFLGGSVGFSKTSAVYFTCEVNLVSNTRWEMKHLVLNYQIANRDLVFAVKTSNPSRPVVNRSRCS